MQLAFARSRRLRNFDGENGYYYYHIEDEGRRVIPLLLIASTMGEALASSEVLWLRRRGSKDKDANGHQ